MKGYIYKCTFRNKIYIGESINALSPNYLGTGKLWTETIKNNRKEVTKEILETIEANNIKELKAKMREREIYWISIYDASNPNIGYNISPGGNLMTEEVKEKMRLNDSKAMKYIMETTDCRERISKSLKEYKKHNGVSDIHRKHLSESLKNRNVGCSGDTRSIPVYCIINNTKYVFHNKVQAAKWWYDNYPISDNYAEITYTRLITNSINGKELKYKGKPINLDIKWFLDSFIDTNHQNIYCIYKSNRYDFNNMRDAIYWWHNTYPIDTKFDENMYKNKLLKNLIGFSIERHSKQYNDIKWFRKETL